MKRKIKICVLMIMLFVALAVGSYSTYAFLTETKTVTNTFKVGEINGEVVVTGNVTTETKVINNEDLAYIHHVDDFIQNQYGLLDTMASQLKISITFNNTFPCRVKVKLPKLDAVPGLLYIVIVDTEKTIDLPISLQVNKVKGLDENGNEKESVELQYGFVQTDGTVNYEKLIDVPNLDVTNLYNKPDIDDESTYATTNEELRTAIQNYNDSILKTLYKGEDKAISGNKSMYFRVLMWGDYYSYYYSLTDTSDTLGYLTKTHSFKVIAEVVQAIDQTKQGGTPKYDED